MKTLGKLIAAAILTAVAGAASAAPEMRMESPEGYDSMAVYSVPLCGVFTLPSALTGIVAQWQMDQYSSSGQTGYFTDNRDGTWTYHYDPRNPTTATFPQFYGENGGGGHGSWLVTVRNEPCLPVMAADSASTDHRRPVTVNVLANDRSMSPSSPLELTGVSRPSRGTVSWSRDGSVTYVPEPGTAGAVAMTYTAQDAQGSLGTSTVTVLSRICKAQEFRPAALDCALNGRPGSADFGGQCTHVPAGYHEIEVPCS